MQLTSSVTCDHRVGIPVVAYKLSTCPRCLGKGVYGGFAVNNAGRLQTYSGKDQLKQSIQKILTERLRDDSSYGFDYNILEDVASDAGASTIIVAEVSRCLSYLKFIQTKEKRYGVGFNPTELLKEIDTIDVQINPNDPREVIVSVSVTSEAFDKVTTTIPLRR